MRVISCGSIEYQKMCHHCGCLLAFAPNEIQTDTTGKFFGADGAPLKFVLCPQCNRAITINKLNEM
jgi:hypothetical protein